MRYGLYILCLITIFTVPAMADQTITGPLSFPGGDSFPYYGCFQLQVNDVSVMRYADGWIENETACGAYIQGIIEDELKTAVENGSETVLTYKTVDFSQHQGQHEWWWCFDAGYYDDPSTLPTYNYIIKLVIDGQDITPKLSCPK